MIYIVTIVAVPTWHCEQPIKQHHISTYQAICVVPWTDAPILDPTTYVITQADNTCHFQSYMCIHSIKIKIFNCALLQPQNEACII